MIAKLIVHQPTRDQAIETMIRALSELRISGIKTTAAFHKAVLKQPEFVDGTVDTKWVERELLPRLKP
jgi:acetyl-CoA carboxylase biotin carboxylase subunit